MWGSEQGRGTCRRGTACDLSESRRKNGVVHGQYCSRSRVSQASKLWKSERDGKNGRALGTTVAEGGQRLPGLDLRNGTDESLVAVGIQLMGNVARDDLEGLFRSHTGPVGTVFGQCSVNISDGDDARFER